MKMTSFLESGRDDTTSELSASVLGRGRRITRSVPKDKDIGRDGTGHRLPEPPPLGDDRVLVSMEATYLMVGDRYDPSYLSPNKLSDMMDLMVSGQVVSHADRALLLRGPKGRGYPAMEVNQPRNVISDWQNALAQSVGRSDMAGVTRATRALGILGRVAVTRLPQ